MQIDAIAPAVQTLQQYFATGKTKSIAWRIEQLEQVKKMASEQEQAIMQALKKDLSKCTSESWISEIGFVISDVEHTIKKLRKWAKPRKVSTPLLAQPGKSYQMPEPLGTVLIIGAWNYPFQLVVSPMVAAIAAGNCVVLKPSELASETSKILAEIVPNYLDQEAFTVVEGDIPETTELLKQKFDHIMYTGGEAVGKIVMRAAAEHLTPVTLELGGKSPCIVSDSANIDVTANRIVWSKWMNAGQTCVAPDYVLVDKKVSAQLIDKLKQKITAFYGDDAKQSPDYGRIINDRHYARISSYLDNQNVIFGGTLDERERYIEPTLLLNPDDATPIMRDEIFGPLLPIIEVDDMEQAITFVNKRSKPLALYLFNKDQTIEDNVMHNTSAGNVCINDGMMFMVNADLPFGGVGNSGMGSYHGQAGFDTFSHLKTVMKRSYMMDLDVRYPPYSDKKLNMLKMLS
jgi:aldehyde dehydrogenase (NAD+)